MAKRKGPKPTNEDLDPEGEGIKEKIDSRHASPLGIYLLQNKMNIYAFAKAMGVAYKTIQELAAGHTEPELALAYEIERVTKGLVPIEAWLGMPKAKKRIATIRSYQPEAVKKQPSVLKPGGAASDEG